jgi:Cadherin domain.
MAPKFGILFSRIALLQAPMGNMWNDHLSHTYVLIDLSDCFQITYALADNTDNFAIDKDTGTITTLKTFDREEKDVYHVKVIATDSSESANHLPGSKMHNQGKIESQKICN